MLADGVLYATRTLQSPMPFFKVEIKVACGNHAENQRHYYSPLLTYFNAHISPVSWRWSIITQHGQKVEVGAVRSLNGWVRMNEKKPLVAFAYCGGSFHSSFMPTLTLSWPESTRGLYPVILNCSKTLVGKHSSHTSVWRGELHEVCLAVLFWVVHPENRILSWVIIIW